MIRESISVQIDAAAEKYRKENGHSPERIILTQDEYMLLNAEFGAVIKNIRGMKIIVRWGKTSNKAISL